MVPLILGEILKLLQKEMILELVDYMDDMAISNEMMKDHLMCLTLNETFKEKFDKIPPKTKAAFTRAYNAEKTEIKKVGRGGPKITPDAKEEDSESDEGDVLLDEDHLAEIKKAKAAEKAQKKELAAMKKLQQHQAN